MNDLTIIIVTWNCRAYIAGCLNAIGLGCAKNRYDVVVADNGSTDGTVDLIREKFPWVTLVENKDNVGFAAANNQAMRGRESRYVLLLNPDTVVGPGALDALMQFLDTHPDAWAAGPAICGADGKVQQPGARFPDNWDIFVEALFLDRLFPRSRIFGRHRELYLDWRIPRSVDYVQGSCVMLRRDVLDKIGGLDEQFFMYFEEVDWCWRMKRKGGQVYYCPLGTIVHLASGEWGHYDERRLVAYHTSLLLFYRKHYSRQQRIVLKPVLILRSALRIAVWTCVALVRPGLRTAALSAIKGYVRTLGLLASVKVSR